MDFTPAALWQTDEFAQAYNDSTTQQKEMFEQQIMELFTSFEKAFQESNDEYVAKMNNLTASLYEKVASVTQHSMVQRSMIMNLYQDYCDGQFYYSFVECFDEKQVPTMSDSFDTLIAKLGAIPWDSITNWHDLQLPEPFDNVSINIL